MKDYYTQEQLDAMSDDDTFNTLKISCGRTSVLHIHMSRGPYRSLLLWHVDWDTGTLTTDMTFLCDGYGDVWQ